MKLKIRLGVCERESTKIKKENREFSYKMRQQSQEKVEEEEKMSNEKLLLSCVKIRGYIFGPHGFLVILVGWYRC